MRIKDKIYEYLETHHSNLTEMERFSIFVQDYFCEVKLEHPEIYEDFKEELEKFTFVITDEVVEIALGELKRKDEKEGIKWTRMDTDAVAKQYVVNKKDGFDPLMWYFGMNYAYAIHYAPNRSIVDYVELANDEIHDVNIPVCKKIKTLYKKLKHHNKEHDKSVK